jgi:NAD(P)-dependent dehydrogenase (short-subunit alcohol dehydrogenase family)
MAKTCGKSERVKIAAFSPFDVINEDDIFRLGGFLSSSYGGVDTVLYNAGAWSVEDILLTVRVNFVGFWMTVEALRPILRRPGRVVAVTSLLGKIAQLPENLRRNDRRWQLDAAYNMITERPDPKSIQESLIRGGWHMYPDTHREYPYSYSKNLQNLAVRRIAAETAAVTELEVNAVCPGLCPTGMNPGGTDTPRKCIETIMWLALGRRNSSLGGRVHGGFFRYKTLGAAGMVNVV